jgi:hypothetical protein
MKGRAVERPSPWTLWPGLLLGVLGVGLPGCNEDHPATAAQILTSLSVEDASGVPETSFSVGQPVTLVFTLTNSASFPVGIALPSTQTYDFVVVSATQTWQWSVGKSFFPNVTTLLFQANETKTFTVEWDQVDNSGAPFAPGPCTASAFVPAATPIPSPSVSFTLL